MISRLVHYMTSTQLNYYKYIMWPSIAKMSTLHLYCIVNDASKKTIFIACGHRMMPLQHKSQTAVEQAVAGFDRYSLYLSKKGFQALPYIKIIWIYLTLMQ